MPQHYEDWQHLVVQTSDKRIGIFDQQPNNHTHIAILGNNAGLLTTER